MRLNIVFANLTATIIFRVFFLSHVTPAYYFFAVGFFFVWDAHRPWGADFSYTTVLMWRRWILKSGLPSTGRVSSGTSTPHACSWPEVMSARCCSYYNGVFILTGAELFFFRLNAVVSSFYKVFGGYFGKIFLPIMIYVG